MSKRPRLPIAPDGPARSAVSVAHAPLESPRVVLAVRGHASLALAFAQQLVTAARERSQVAVVTSLSPHAGTPAVFRAAGAVAALAPDDSFVGGAPGGALRAWLSELPAQAWLIAAGSEACALIVPTFSIGMGKRHEMVSAATDLWLGQASEVVAAALVAALHVDDKLTGRAT